MSLSRCISSLALALVAVGALAMRTAPPTWSTFFEGRWGCSGSFANGRPLAADVEFTPRLGGKWLEYHHHDRPPGAYEVLALWGPIATDTTPIATVLHDNGGGHRRFTSSGWTGTAIVLARDTTEPGARAERFTYRRTSDSTFWFGWEVQRQSAWAIGDSLTCTRARR